MSDYICSELIEEIFTWLPAKSLLRFRSVSKSLRARISSPDFIRKHALQCKPKYFFRHKINIHDYKDYYTVHSEDQLPLDNSGGYDDKTTLKLPYNDTSEIVGSCNGILCVYEQELSRDHFSLWNPSIRRKLKISDDFPFRGPNFLWNPHDTVGFGFDPINDDYKIVLLSYTPTGKCAFVYSMKTDGWSKIEAPSTPFSEVSAYGCLFNGALYWIAGCDSSLLDDSDRHYILKFDLSTHAFDMIVLPKPDWGCHTLGIIKGSLAVFSTTHKESWIFVREEYECTSSWYVFHKSDSQIFIKEDKFLELTTTGDFLLHRDWSTPEVYNLETGLSKTLAERLNFSRIFYIEKFVESLELFGKGMSYEEKQPFFA